MKRLALAVVVGGWLISTTGCCAPKAIVCGAHLPAVGAAVFRPFGYCFGCNLGCGEKYFHDGWSPVPDCCEPCDGCGNWVGRENSWDYRGRGGPHFSRIAPRCSGAGDGMGGGCGACVSCGGCDDCGLGCAECELGCGGGCCGGGCDSCGGFGGGCASCGGGSTCGGCGGAGCDMCGGSGLGAYGVGRYSDGSYPGPNAPMGAYVNHGKYGGQDGYWNDSDYWTGPRGHTDHWPRRKRYRGSEFSYGLAQPTVYQYALDLDVTGHQYQGSYGSGGGCNTCGGSGYDQGSGGGCSTCNGGGYQGGETYHEGMTSPGAGQPTEAAPPVNNGERAPQPAPKARPKRNELPPPTARMDRALSRSKVSESSSAGRRNGAGPGGVRPAAYQAVSPVLRIVR